MQIMISDSLFMAFVSFFFSRHRRINRQRAARNRCGALFFLIQSKNFTVLNYFLSFQF